MMTTMTAPKELSAPKERRVRPRHGLDGVQGNLPFSRTCRVLNLSAKGVAIETATALAPGRSYAVHVEHEGQRISLSGTVAWCRLRGTSRNEKDEIVPTYLAGIELQSDLTDRAEEVLPLLLARSSQHLERRLPAHLTPAGTDATAPATIVEVSRTGLRMESPCIPEEGSLLAVRVELDDLVLPVTARVTNVRPLQEREGEAWAEIRADYAAMSAADRRRLDRLIREESGLGSKIVEPS